MMRLTVIGNIGNDAQAREVNGRKFVTFNVAVSAKYKDKQSGAEVEKTTWVGCTRDGLQNVDQYLKKGTQVYIEGTPSVNVYQDREGRTQAQMQVNVHTLKLLGGARDGHQQPQQQAQGGGDGAPF